MKQANQLAEMDMNELGTDLEDFQDETLNRAVDKFLVLDQDQMSLEVILNQFTEVDSTDYDLVYTAVEETLKSVNEIFRNLGIELEFKSADMVDYGGFILTAPKDTTADMAKRVRRLVDGQAV